MRLRLTGQPQERLLLEGLRNLPLDDQVLLELYYWEDLGGRELGEVLGLPENTARTRLRRARLALTARLQALGASSDALRSTIDNLEDWATAIRGYLNAEGSA